MICWLLILSTILIVNVKCRETDKLQFNEGKETLYTCIVKQDFFDGEHFYKDYEIISSIADRSAKILSRKKISRDAIVREVKSLIVDLRSGEYIQLKQFPWSSLETSTVNALVNCSESNEDHEFSLADVLDRWLRILDYILVGWSISRQKMISTRDGRKLIRRYAADAESLLEESLGYTSNYDYFRIAIRNLWMHRARLYFDAGNTLYPYPAHNYTTDNLVPHLSEDMDRYSSRRLRKFSDRDSPVPKWYLNRILNIHDAERPSNGELDIFVKYEKKGMTWAEYYFEKRIIQFYQILFFVQELRAKGVTTDQDDIYDGKLPCHVMTEELQTIAYNDDSYRDYLLMRRDLSIDSENEIERNLANRARVREEDLIFLSNTLVNNVFKTTCSTMLPEDNVCRFVQTREPSHEVGLKNRHVKSEFDKVMDSCFSQTDMVSDICSLLCESHTPQRIEHNVEQKAHHVTKVDFNEVFPPREESSIFTKILNVLAGSQDMLSSGDLRF